MLTGIREKVCPSVCSETFKLFLLQLFFWPHQAATNQWPIMTHFWDQKRKVQNFHNSERERARKTVHARFQREYTIMHRLAEPEGEHICNLQPYLLDTTSKFVHSTVWRSSVCICIDTYSEEQGLFYRRSNTAVNIQNALKGTSTAAERYAEHQSPTNSYSVAYRDGHLLWHNRGPSPHSQTGLGFTSLPWVLHRAPCPRVLRALHSTTPLSALPKANTDKI